MRAALCLIVALLAACARPLSPGEADFAARLLGPRIDVAPIRIHDGNLVGWLRARRPARPRIACRERIWPPPAGPIVQTFTPAITLANTVLLAHDLYLPDTLPGWPGRVFLPAAMLMGHEFTHVWQWQNRRQTGYTPLRAAREHRAAADPYLFDLTTRARFLDYGYEQQGAIVEEYICCAALDPTGRRTERLRRLLRPHLALAPFERKLSRSEIVLPWDGARLRGICSD